MKVVLIDHEDSFVYNLAQSLTVAGARVVCLRYTVPFSDLRREDADAFVFSPGPGHPSDTRVTGLARRVLSEYSTERPTLGVCLGHQLIGEYCGGRVVRGTPVHGQTAAVHHSGDELFAGVPSPFDAARYHSLVIDPATVPPSLTVTARTRKGEVMAVRHRGQPVVGVQFHPESFLTRGGPRIVENFLAEARR
jgi:anthranilate synthase/aminodeoxychorismate synthase-like glutamine amidotransferase